MRPGGRHGSGDGQGCQGCGVCCDLYGHTLNVVAGDLARWRAEGREDLLGRVGPGGELWWAEDGSGRLDHCPFFSWQGADRGTCGVHGTKPAQCRAYPTPLHGPRCVMGARFPGGYGKGETA